MSLSEKAIEEFKELYRIQYGENISNEDAYKMGENLISLFKILCRDLPNNEE
jgi:hypothetical protein